MEINDVPQFFKNLRKENGLTQEELALNLGVSKGTIRQYETGQRKPNFEISQRIEKMYNDSQNVIDTSCSISKRLKELREEHDLTQEEFAEALGISKAAIKQYERSERTPNYDVMLKLEKLFGVSPCYLAGESDDKLDCVSASNERTPITQIIGERLKELRLEKELTQQQLSEELNLSYKSIVNYENGYREPKTDVLYKLAQYFNVYPAYIRGETDERNEYESVTDDNMEIAYSVSKRIKELRVENHLTQQELADKIGVSRVTVGKYETSKCIPGFEVIIKFEQLFHVSAAYLAGLTDEKGINSDSATTTHEKYFISDEDIEQLQNDDPIIDDTTPIETDEVAVVPDSKSDYRVSTANLIIIYLLILNLIVSIYIALLL